MRRKLLAKMLVMIATSLSLATPAVADPSIADIAPPLPVVVPAASNWQPKFPYPYDQSRSQITDADVAAEREMCQWYDAQYQTLLAQIDRFDNQLIRSNGDYGVAGNDQLANAVAANIDQTVDFLAPRAQALTISQDFANDQFWPLYQGESFYRVWQQLSNVSAGIKGRQPAWFYGPSLQQVERWGSRINRSHVCR